jgi:hypothetical protein
VMPEWGETLLAFLSGGPRASTTEVLLRGGLVGCSLFASIQLLTMLSTRWGERNAMAKSLFLSVLVHLCLGLGWATAVRSQQFLTDPPGDPAPIPIQNVLLESEDPISQPDDGTTPIWQRPLDQPEMQLSRAERDAVPVDDQPPEPSDIDPVAPPLMEIPQLAAAVADPQVQPEPAKREVAAVSPTEAAPLQDVAAPAPEAEARAEVRPQAPRARQTMTRAPEALPQLQTAPLAGGSLRTSPQPEDLALSIPLPTDPQPTSPRATGEMSDRVVRRASPSPFPVDDPSTGSDPRNPAARAQSAASQSNPRFSRSGTTANRGVADADPVPRIGTERVNASSPSDRVAMTRTPAGLGPEGQDAPEIQRAAPKTDGSVKRPAQAATTYRLRRLERRKEIALRNGGTVQSEQAVEAALAWLAKTQEPQGFWDADKHGGGLKEVRQIDKEKPPGGTEADAGLTGLAVLAYLGAGYTHEEGNYAEVVSRAIRWLIDQQRTDGYLGGTATYYDQMYCHAIATYALAEAVGMQSDPTQYQELREAVNRGIWYIVQTQNQDGGWRYRVGVSESDMSMFGWQLMALKSAELAGQPIPADTRSGMVQFLKDRSRGSQGGLAGYKQQDPPTPAMTAEALFCKQMFGLKRSNASSQEAVDYLSRTLPNLSQPDEYYWYYGTLAMYQYGGEPWDRWNVAMRETLLKLQRRGGELDGSWDPSGPWGSVGGRVYSTTVGVLCLEVYYRFLPLYRATGQ